jgi:hypothetical protein
LPDLEVDLAGLDAFARRLDRICDALQGAENALRGHDDALGDGTVVSALDRFEDRWRDGREKIEENAATLSTMVTESVATYRKADNDLASSLRTARE